MIVPLLCGLQRFTTQPTIAVPEREKPIPEKISAKTKCSTAVANALIIIEPIKNTNPVAISFFVPNLDTRSPKNILTTEVAMYLQLVAREKTVLFIPNAPQIAERKRLLLALQNPRQTKIIKKHTIILTHFCCLNVKFISIPPKNSYS
jgi:hypothetical protein